MANRRAAATVRAKTPTRKTASVRKGAAAGKSAGTGRRRKRRKQRENRSKAILTFIVVCAAVCLSGFVLKSINLGGNIFEKDDEAVLKYIDKQTQKQNYLPNITIDGVSVGGMNKEDAAEKLKNEIKLPEDDVALTIASDSNSYTKTCTMDDFGIYFDVEGAEQSAYTFGRTGTDEQKIAEFRLLENTPKNYEVMFYDEAKVKTVVDGIAGSINVEPVNAAVTRTDSGFNVSKSVIGYSMDSNALYESVIKTIKDRNFKSTVTFAVTQTNPKYTEEDFKYINNEIGSCYSRYKGGDENRIANLRNGCAKINGTVVYPDEVFSTNAHFNPCTYENGWRSAGTIVKGKVEDSIGGGMCQVSSALYQAVLEAELEVVERHNHSLKVGYADYAYDATLAGDYKDLKFRNDTKYPLYIESYLTSSNVVVKIYGYEKDDAGHKVEFANKFIKSTEPDEPKIVTDSEKYEGYEEQTVSPLNGMTYELYKYVYENGTLKDTVKVNTSVYSPRRAEITKGTKKREEKKPEPQTETPTEAPAQPAESNEQQDSGQDGSDSQAAEPEAVLE